VDHPNLGATILYGAVKPGSYGPIGSKVSKGKQIAVIGKYPKGSTMLHIEAWKLGTIKPRPTWSKGDPPQSNLDITPYLQAAKSNVMPDPDQKQKLCGGDVTADDGALNLDAPCSTINGVQVCNAFNIQAWQDSLQEELDALSALIIATEYAKKDKGSVKTAITAAQASLVAGQAMFDKWGLFTLTPSDAVSETSEATRQVRCSKLTLLGALDQVDQDQNNGNGNGNQGNGGNQDKGDKGSSSSGGGLAIGLAVLVGAGLYLRKKRG